MANLGLKREQVDDLQILASNVTFRAGVLTEAERKAAAGKAPVYMYYFTWRSPVHEGKLKAFHTLEISFVFGMLTWPSQ